LTGTQRWPLSVVWQSAETGRFRATSSAGHYDVKFLVHIIDDTLAPEDMALGYKQMIRVEQAWRDMKSTLDMRPVFHWAAAPHSRARGDHGAASGDRCHAAWYVGGVARRSHSHGSYGPACKHLCRRQQALHGAWRHIDADAIHVAQVQVRDQRTRLASRMPPRGRAERLAGSPRRRARLLDSTLQQVLTIQV
jgi:hypothetical protein